MNLKCFAVLDRPFFRRLSRQVLHRGISGAANKLPSPSLDVQYLKDPRNEEEIIHNIKARKSGGCIKTFKSVLGEYDSASQEEKPALWDRLISAGLKIPNRSDPRLIAYGETPHVKELLGEKPAWSFSPKEFHTIAKDLELLRTENLGNLTGQRSYYFIKELAQLEQALIHYTVDTLISKGFTLYSVPDLLRSSFIESCGMDTRSERTQVTLTWRALSDSILFHLGFFFIVNRSTDWNPNSTATSVCRERPKWPWRRSTRPRRCRMAICPSKWPQ